MSKKRETKRRKSKVPTSSKTGDAKGAARKKADRLKPVKLSVKQLIGQVRDEGPRGWFLPQIEAAYTRLAPSGTVSPPVPTTLPAHGVAFASSLQPGEGESVFADVAPAAWIDRLAEYKRRKAAVNMPAVAGLEPPAPFIPGARNWLPLGPSVVLEGQTVGTQPVGGRVAGLAIVPGGQLIYAASASGGVFRSDDGGAAWRSLMDGFDVDPTNFASASLACGAIAIDIADPRRVYVGTGEGDTHQVFSSRIVNALPAYRGIGPIRTDDGGTTWLSEPTAADSPPLAGEAFFALAVDPDNRDNVVGATTVGLYQRVLQPDGTPEWVRRRQGVHSSVVVAAAGNTTRFFTALWGVGVFHSADGNSWTRTGTGFPTSGVGRIALAVQPQDPNRIYAFVANTEGAVHGIYRLDSVGGTWKQVVAPPDVLPTDNGASQGDYDLAIAVDPMDANIIYLGGSYYNDHDMYPGSIWRGRVQASGTGYKFASSASIGTHAHADIHVLLHSPGDPDELWCGCDGGVFLNRAPREDGQFAGLNTGLACLCSNFIAQHPTDPHVLFTGLQDNGTAQTSGSPMWTHVNYGDGGYCLINWATPDRVLSFLNGRVFRSDTGGATHESWSQFPVWSFGWATMTQPIVGPPYNPASPSDANIVAIGAGSLVFVSKDFATSWPASGRITLPGGTATGSVFALAFASATRLFIGTTRGRVFQADWSGNAWSTTRLDDATAGPLGLHGLISDIAVDWADANLASVYVAFGGMGDRRRVWRFDGTRWEVRSGTSAETNLLDVEHNALAVDRAPPHNVYVGADIGVWQSPDAGLSWQPIQNGLPDAPVFDLQIHPTHRLLRAATHGRGVYEIPLE